MCNKLSAVAVSVDGQNYSISAGLMAELRIKIT